MWRVCAAQPALHLHKLHQRVSLRSTTINSALWRCGTFPLTSLADPAKMSIILDFDGTVTEKDTINVLAGYFTGLSARKQETWQEIVDLYLQSIYDLEMQYRPPVEARRDLQEELDYLQAIRRCESDSIGRVEKSRIFDRAELGLTPKNHQDGMYELGQMTVKTGTVRVRAGFQHFLQNLLDREWKIGVLSLVCAARRLIHFTSTSILFSHTYLDILV